jgi:hypothetical protein
MYLHGVGSEYITYYVLDKSDWNIPSAPRVPLDEVASGKLTFASHRYLKISTIGTTVCDTLQHFAISVCVC